jgi:hypothetical protein
MSIELLKQFVFNGLLLGDTLARLEDQGISVRGHLIEDVVAGMQDRDFSPRIIYDANKMAGIYIAFFCLENAVRELIIERLLERHGIDWWNTKVPAKIRSAVEKLKEKEDKNRYHTKRSIELIGYSMFGNLAQIIITNWEDFSDLFPDQAWISARFNDLEMSRNIIMHTGILPQIEIDRIESIARDWIRQVG